MEELRVWAEDPEEAAGYVLEQLDGQPYIEVAVPDRAGEDYRQELEQAVSQNLPPSYFIEDTDDRYISIGRRQTRIGRIWDNVVKG